jgi:uncharacterized protein YbjT (DUF2867 family)
MSNATVTPTSVSPYKAAGIVNALLLAEGIEKVLPPQMFYNYTTARIRADKAPLIPVVEVAEGKYEISLEGLGEWATKYIAKLQAKAPVEA